jgi:hypothetical protein
VERSGTLGIQINRHTALKERKRPTPASRTIVAAIEIPSAFLWPPSLDRFFRSFRAAPRYFTGTQGSAALHPWAKLLRAFGAYVGEHGRPPDEFAHRGKTKSADTGEPTSEFC